MLRDELCCLNCTGADRLSVVSAHALLSRINAYFLDEIGGLREQSDQVDFQVGPLGRPASICGWAANDDSAVLISLHPF